jgi:hypothetical protein
MKINLKKSLFTVLHGDAVVFSRLKIERSSINSWNPRMLHYLFLKVAQNPLTRRQSLTINSILVLLNGSFGKLSNG